MHNSGNYGIRRVFIIVACLAVFFTMLFQPSFAEDDKAVSPSIDPIENSEGYSAVVYDNTNGLPTAEANAIAQTSEGFIWIGSYAGLIRYDGNTFERRDSTDGIDSVSCLLVDKSDRLWIGTNDNGVAVIYHDEITIMDIDDGLGSDKVCDIRESEDGTVYVGTTAGITMFSPDMEATRIDDNRIANAYIECMNCGKNGILYCTTNNNDVFILRDGNLVNYYGQDDYLPDSITFIFPDPDNQNKVYVGTEEEGIFYGDLKSGLAKSDHIETDPLFSITDIQKLGDQIWVCGRNGIGVIDDGKFHVLDDLPMNNSLGHVMMDYEGNLWFTSTRQGVMKLVPNRFTDLFKRLGLDSAVVNTTCLYDGGLVIGSDKGLTVTDSENRISTLHVDSAMTASGESLAVSDLTTMLDGIRIRSVIRDSKDRLWISTWKSDGLIRYDHGDVMVFSEDDGLLSDYIRAVYEMDSGAMMVVLSGGINIIDGDSVTAAFDKSSGLDNEVSLTACEAPNGDILVGSNGGGIYIINDGGVRSITKKDGLSSDIIMRIKHDPENNVFWIVAGNSIAYLTEDYEVSTIHKFPYPDNFDIFENDKGDMWIISSDGYYVVPAEELIANEEINPVHYTIENGIPCVATSNAYSELTEDGDLYLAGRTGVTKFNINDSFEAINDIRQAVPYAEADGERFYPDESGTITLPSDVQKITIYGFVYNYSLTDPVVSYYLKGFDRKSVTVKRSELDPVIYTNLPGGSYTFVMELKDAMGREDKTLSVPIVKTKAVYEETWFMIALALGIGIFLARMIQLQIQRREAAIEKKHKEQIERERVNNELYMANQIQTGVLPHEFPPFPDHNEFDLYASMTPAREVGGDFYDFFMIDDNHLCMVIADVSGKGIPAALFMMNAKSIIKSFAMEIESPAEIMTKVNKEIYTNNQMDLFVTVWLGILELSSGKLTASNAGHEYPVVERCGTGFELFKDKHGFVIGGMDETVYSEYELYLQSEDRIFLYTDGVTEAMNSEQQLFGTERLIDALNTDSNASPEQMLKNVSKAIIEFVKDAEQFDDITMLAIEYNGPDQSDETYSSPGNPS